MINRQWKPPVDPPAIGASDDDEDVPDRRSLKKAAASIVAGRSITSSGDQFKFMQLLPSGSGGSGRLSARQSTGTWNGGIVTPQKRRTTPRMPRRRSSAAEALKEEKEPTHVIDSSTDTFIVRICNYKFVPSKIKIRLGTLIRFEVDETEPKMIEYSIESTDASTNKRPLNSDILTAGSSFKIRFVTEGRVCYRDLHNDMAGTIEVESRGISESARLHYEELSKEEEAEQRLLAGIGTGLGLFGRPLNSGAVEELECEEELEKMKQRRQREKDRGEAIRLENNRLEEQQKVLEKDPRYRIKMQQQREQLVADSLRIHRERREKGSDLEVLLNNRVSSPPKASRPNLSRRIVSPDHSRRISRDRRLSGDDIYDF